MEEEFRFEVEERKGDDRETPRASQTYIEKVGKVDLQNERNVKKKKTKHRLLETG